MHARNIATSTAVETGKPVDEYIARCLSLMSGDYDSSVMRFSLSAPPNGSRGK